MAAQRGFALGVGAGLQLFRHVLQHFDVGHDALGLDRFAGRRVVAGGGETQRAVAGAERDDGLHRTLAERTGADQRRTLVVLQRAGNDLGCRCRAAIDQTISGLPLVRSPGCAARRWVSSALRPRVETISPRSRNVSETVTASSSNPPGLFAQIDDEALQLVADLRRQVADFPLQAFGGLLVERGDADIGDIVGPRHARAPSGRGCCRAPT